MPVANPLRLDELKDNSILCGPMLRRVETHEINVFVALAQPAVVELLIYDAPDPSTQQLVTSHSELGLAPAATVALGAHLHVVNIKLDISSGGATVNGLSPAHLYGYDLRIRNQPGDSTYRDLNSLGLLADPFPLGYQAGRLPGFALPPQAIEQINLHHGSCRKPHGEGKDMLAHLDRMVAGNDQDFSIRPHILLLTGDQIYADDVSKPFLRTLNDTARALLGWSETYRVTELLTATEYNELSADIDSVTNLIDQKSAMLDDAILSNDAGTFTAADRTALIIDLQQVLSGSGQIDDALPLYLPAQLRQIPHFAMMHISNFYFDGMRDDLQDRLNFLPTVVLGTSAFTIQLGKLQEQILEIKFQLHRIELVLGELTSDGYWGESDTGDSSVGALSRIAPPQRAAEIVQHAELSSDAMDAHLLFLGEWYMMYLMVWSDVLWDIEDDVARRIATEREAVPNYGLTGPNSIRVLKKDIETLNDFALDTPHVRRLLANTPTLMIFDDHEVTDDWNLNHDWVRLVNNSRAGPQLLRNALVAYAIFQDWGNRPEDYESGGIGREILDYAESNTDAQGNYLPPALFGSTNQQTNTVLHDRLGLGTAAFSTDWTTKKRWDFRYPRLYVPGNTWRIIFLDTRTHREFPDDTLAASILSDLKLRLSDLSDPNPQIGKILPPALLSNMAFQFQLAGHLRNDQINIVVSPAPVFGLPVIEDLVQPVMSEKQNPELYDQEAWQNSPQAFEALLSELKGYDVILLSGDVHYGFSNVIAFKDEVAATSTSESRIVQLCSSSLKNETPMTRGLGSYGYSGAGLEVFSEFGSPEMRREYNRAMRLHYKEFLEDTERYRGAGIDVGLGRLTHDAGSDFQTWWNETASLFDPVTHFMQRKDISLFTIPRVFPFGLLGMGYGLIPFWNLAVEDTTAAGEYIREKFRVYFLYDYYTTEQSEVVGYNNIGRLHFVPDANGDLSEVSHQLHWLVHDENNEATDDPMFTEHATLPVPGLFRRALAKQARQERQRWRTPRGGVIKERRPDGSHDSRAMALLNLYYRIAGLGAPEIEDGGNITWSAAFISFLITQAGGADLFVPATAHIDYLRAAKSNRLNEDQNNPFWLFKVSEREPQIGDIVARDRSDTNQMELTYDNLFDSDPAIPGDFRPSHCDVITDIDDDAQTITVIGGNLGGSVRKNSYNLVNNKVSETDYFGLLAIDRHRTGTN